MISRFLLALFLVSAFASGCKTSPGSDGLRLNQIQVIGTHNSYHQHAPDSLVRVLASRSPATVQALDYSHRPLPEQLELQGRRIALERNGEIVPRSQFDAVELADGDALEIVVAVGGG